MRRALGFSVLQVFFRTVIGFCTKKISVFRFWYLLRFAASALFRSRFSVLGENKMLVSDLLFDAIWCFSGFSSENMRLNDLNRVHVSSDFPS